MANGAMKYKNEEEEADFILAGASIIYTYANTGHTKTPKIIVDKWVGENSPTVTAGLTSVTITGANGNTGHISIINCDG